MSPRLYGEFAAEERAGRHTGGMGGDLPEKAEPVMAKWEGTAVSPLGIEHVRASIGQAGGPIAQNLAPVSPADESGEPRQPQRGDEMSGVKEDTGIRGRRASSSSKK